VKVLHLPTVVGGMPWGLAQGERQKGLNSDVLALFRDEWKFSADRVLFEKPHELFLSKLYGLVIRMKEAYQIRNQYQVFHFNYGTSLIDLWKIGMPLLDVPFYKGKIVMTYNGCDARQKYPTLRRNEFSACHNNQCYEGICVDGKLDRMKRKRIRKCDRYADTIFTVNPDLLHFLPERARFLPYTVGSWNQIKVAPYRANQPIIRILHSPTDRGAKGSKLIIQTLQKLKGRYGERVSLSLVEHLPNREALHKYAEADLAIDQVLIGWYGGFAVEMMKMGKPVMAFIREDDLKFIPKEMAQECRQAIINVGPGNLYEKLCFVLENPEVLKDYREAGLDYVHRWHDPIFVAGITKSAYEGEA
jgi:hypothetical protein